MDKIAYLGEQIEMSVKLDKIDGVAVTDVTLTVFTSPQRKLEIGEKKYTYNSASDSYSFILETVKLGVGRIACVATGYIPDERMDDGRRVVMCKIVSDVHIVSPY